MREIAYFDEHGRRNPPRMDAPAHPTSRRYYQVAPPNVSHHEVHERAVKLLGVQMRMYEYGARQDAILKRICDVDAVELLSGPRVPFILPRHATMDVGKAMDDLYLPAVKAAFWQKCGPKHEFTNHCGGMEGKVAVEPESRHTALLKAMEAGEVVGWYFPCVMEYSVPAALEQMAELPDDFLLSGGFDTAAALVGTPDLLMRRDGYAPLLWLAALRGEKPGVGYHFEAYGRDLTFNRRAHLGNVSEYWSSGLTVIG